MRGAHPHVLLGQPAPAGTLTALMQIFKWTPAGQLCPVGDLEKDGVRPALAYGMQPSLESKKRGFPWAYPFLMSDVFEGGAGTTSRS